jgi:hypothetical protein
MEALHPRRTVAFPADVMNARINDPYQTTEASVLKCIQNWGSRISPGPSQLTRDHVKQLVNDMSSVCLAPLTDLVNLMLAGTLDAAAADWIGAGCLSALGKPGPTGAPTRDDQRGPPAVGRIRLVESTPEAVESTPVESTSEFDWVESTGLGLSQNDCCCVNSTVSRLDSVVELTARRPDCARRADCSAA